MRKIKCDDINIKILFNENDFLKKEVERLKCELFQMNAETIALHTITMPLLKNRIAWCDEENKKKINNLEEKLQTVRVDMAMEIIEMLIPDCEVCEENWHEGCLCLRATIAEKIAKQYGVEIEE
jgi:hypothetical protein